MITILADDITGAAEIAGVCLRCGLTVSFGVNKLPSAKTQARVVATDSRSMSNQEARLLHRELAEAIGNASAQSVFKKTDSVLRGYVVAELDEWMDVLGFEEAVLQPSNPSIGRCITEGRYQINGIDLHSTDFRHDSDFPAWTSSVEGLLMERNGNHPSRKIFTGTALPFKKGIHVPDCQQVEDLKKSVFKNNPSILHAGSAAFFAAWLEVVHDLIPKPQPFHVNPLQGRFLMVCGSKHTQSESYLLSSKKKGLAVAEFPEELLQEHITEEHLFEWADNQAEFWGRTGQMIVTQGHRKVTFPGHALALRNRLAEVVIRMLEQCAVGELLLEGGATTFALLEKKGWTTLTPLLEFSPGIVRMAVTGKPNLFLTLKPGSYPWPAWEGNQTEESNE
jgi:D-threonate/D-erythronate kinase